MKVTMTHFGLGNGEFSQSSKVKPKPKVSLKPQWRLREGESVRFERTDEDEHNGLECVIERNLFGYLTEAGEKVDTCGGAYKVRFPCGCDGLVFEHELRRDGETLYRQ